MELILKKNIFEFNKDLFKQLVGAAMGTPPAPSYANIYLAERIDRQIREMSKNYGKNDQEALKMLKGFLDDIFQIFIGISKDLHKFFEDINQIHPSLKFTLIHTTPKSELKSDSCPCKPLQSVPYLDTSCSIEKGKIELDLYRKETNRNQYVLPESCHSKMVTRNIPFSLSLRIVRPSNLPSKSNPKKSNSSGDF